MGDKLILRTATAVKNVNIFLQTTQSFKIFLRTKKQKFYHYFLKKETHKTVKNGKNCSPRPNKFADHKRFTLEKSFRLRIKFSANKARRHGLVVRVKTHVQEVLSLNPSPAVENIYLDQKLKLWKSNKALLHVL